MKHRPYPKYKDSGVEWLGDVPEHWEVKPLKMVANIRYGIGEPPQYVDEGISLIRATNVNAGKIETANLVMVDPKEISASRIVWLHTGDIIVVRSGAYTGDSAIIPSEFDGSIAGFDMVLTTRKLNRQFLSYILLSRYMKEGQLDLEKMRAAQPHLNAEELGNCFVLYPHFSEQQAIATFLDRKTAKIDDLIDKKQELVERLREKRTALISHAVTKGLDSKAKMKPSGVEWLGEVPVGWEVWKLGHFVFMKSGEAITAEEIESEGDFPVYGGNGLRGYFDRYTHEGHFALIGRQGALCGNINYGMGKFWASEHAVVVKSLRPTSTIWLGELLRIMNLNQYSVSAAQPGLAIENIKDLIVPLPPFSEQQAIATFLIQETGKLDALITKVEEAVKKLKEYRSALISAAVTGKIDVRDFA